jgi:hypothetical protein
MPKREDALHIAALLRNPAVDKLKLAKGLRAFAIEKLDDVKRRFPRRLSKHIAAIYRQRGIDLSWRLDDIGDAIAFYLSVDRNALSRSERNAVELLRACTHALERGQVDEHTKDWMVLAYAGLDDDATVLGESRLRSQRQFAERHAERSREDAEHRHKRWITEAREIWAKPQHQNRSRRSVAKMIQTRLNLCYTVDAIARAIRCADPKIVGTGPPRSRKR